MKDYKAYVLFMGGAIILASAILGGSIIYSGKTGSVATTQPTEIQEPLEQPNQPTAPPVRPTPKPKFKITKADHGKGSSSAKVKVTVFTDLQCPYCQRFHSTLMDVFDEYSSKVYLSIKHFPLDSIHPNARPAAQASECAGEQDKFWEFVDEIFNNQSKFSDDYYFEVAANLGLNSTQFKKCVEDEKYKDKVSSDYQEGIDSGISGTPATFINDESLIGAVPNNVLKDAIEAELNK
ncbi:thioredoxin domain-containing protein [Patescibacteria group bacterium]|nr:thioredoxin domain-containing protein [Patescibacteria group bacterium]